MKAHLNSLRRLPYAIGVILTVAWTGGSMHGVRRERSHTKLPIAIEAACHDFGKVPVGAKLRHTFRWTNESLEPVRVAKVTTTCGCLAHEEGHRSVGSGESGYITVAMKTLGLSAPARLKKVAWVEFEGLKKRYSVALAVSAEVRPDIAVTPSEAVFTRQGSGVTCSSGIDIHREMLSSSDFATLRLVRLAPYYTVKETVRSKGQVRVLLRLRHIALPTYLPPLEFEYHRGRVLHLVSVPVRRPSNMDGVSIEPGSYLAKVTSSMVASDLEGATKRTLRMVTSGCGEVVITGIVARSADHPFGWAPPRGKSGQFQLWVQRLPGDKRIASATLVVSYYDARTHRRGTVDLHAYVISKRR